MTASTTNYAIKALVEHEFDLVITDLILAADRGSDGREVAIAAKRSSRKTKVIIITSYVEMSQTAELIGIVDGLVSKGNDVAGILPQMISLLLQASSERNAEDYKIGKK